MSQSGSRHELQGSTRKQDNKLATSQTKIPNWLSKSHAGSSSENPYRNNIETIEENPLQDPELAQSSSPILFSHSHAGPKNPAEEKKSDEKAKSIYVIPKPPRPVRPLKDPFLDKEVTRHIAKSLIHLFKNTHKSSSKARAPQNIVSIIRKKCRPIPFGHYDDITLYAPTLLQLHLEQLKDNQKKYGLNKQIHDCFLRMVKDLPTQYKLPIKPAVIRAILNFNEDLDHIKSFSQGILNWDMTDYETKAVAIHLFSDPKLHESWTDPVLFNTDYINDLVISLKSQIESILLDICLDIVVIPNMDINRLFVDNREVANLVRKSALSSECFQICTGVLNLVFCRLCFNSEILKFISSFVKSVRNLSKEYFPYLYSSKLKHIAFILNYYNNLDQNQFSTESIGNLKKIYVSQTLQHLENLQGDSAPDFVMILSHFPEWFHKCTFNVKSPILLELNI